MNTPQNKAPSKVLACVDQSTFADSVADYAAWAAERLGAPLELLHVIDRHPEVGTGDDLSGAIGVNAQEHLLADLAATPAGVYTSPFWSDKFRIDRFAKGRPETLSFRPPVFH